MDLSEEARESFSAWVGLRRDELLRTAYLLTGDLSRAEDALQDALVKVAQRWGRLRDGNPDGYVRQIIYHAHASWWRSRREYAVPAVLDQATAPDESVDRSLVLRQALGRLTPGQRAVIVLRYLDDVTEYEAARVLGISVGTVKSQSAAAIRRLRDLAPELVELTGPACLAGVDVPAAAVAGHDSPAHASAGRPRPPDLGSGPHPRRRGGRPTPSPFHRASRAGGRPALASARHRGPRGHPC